MSEKRTEKIHRTKEEKLRIIEECQKNGITETCKKYGIYPSSYSSWVRKHKLMGPEGLTHGMTREQQKEIRRLEKENEVLKKMIAEKELENHLHMEMLKKKFPEVYKKN